MGNKRIPLEPDKYYHVYNHAVANNQLFTRHDNYLFFLEKIVEHICPVADIFSYCLMPNHFHIALRIKSENEILEYWQIKGSQGFQNPEGLGSEQISKKLSHQFGNLFNKLLQGF